MTLVDRPTCGHPGATFALEGVLYCARCANYAWQHFVHRGHADEPPPVPIATTGLIESSPLAEPIEDELEVIHLFGYVLTDQGRNALAELCAHCGLRRATWCEVLCSECASLTAAEVIEYAATGHHPRVAR